ncbi:uncharacterized protein [Coffea arabica]|uniref:Sphingomyelin phosphodiesterase 4-like n=1 Tax=Coffea arabica TaxID=13443 RepID=A0ABM4VDM1_COFAR|nr:uncharacterized protein LOC113702685 [Coffea arabica]
MIGHSYGMDAQAKATELETTILAAASPPQIAAACSGVEAFLQKHTPDQSRWFFSITFPTLICKTFGFDESSLPSKSQSPNGWIDIAMLSRDSELAGKIFGLLSPNGVLMSSISAVDRLSLVKYVFPIERLPEWVRYMLQNKRDCQVLMDLCPLFRNKVKEDSLKGSPCQVQLNVLEYFLFWFVYYPVCKGSSDGPDGARVRRSRKFRLENWAYSIPGLCSSKRGMEQKNDVNLYCRLLYAYFRAFVPMVDLSAHQPYRSSLLHYSWGHDTSVIERAEFLVNSLIHFWLVDNDFSPLPVSLCKSYGVTLPFRSIFGETPPTSGLGEVITLFVKYLTLNSVLCIEGHDKFGCNGYPPRKVSGSVDVINSKEITLDFTSNNSWNIWVQRPLYRFVLRTFLFCPVESSIKNVSQVFTVWVTYMEPWKVNLQEFAELDATLGMPQKSTSEVTQTSENGYSTAWQTYVLANYLYYSSLVMHFFGFAHKFLHTDPEVIIQMVSKVINLLTSSTELMDLIKIMDTAYHSKPTGSSKLVPNALYSFVPAIREQLQDWENGLCETAADGSFLHDNWNKDLRLFSGGEDGGQQLLQLFVLRAESELQAISGDNVAQSLKCLDSLKAQLSCLFGGPILGSSSRTPEKREHVQTRDEMFRPRSFGHHMVSEVKYKGDWMKRPISDDEIAWLAKLLVDLSAWLNESLGLNQVNSSQGWPAWSYVDLSGNAGNVSGFMDTMKIVFLSLFSWFTALGKAGLMFMRKRGLKVNLRILASKKIVMVLLMVAAFSISRKAFS